MEEKILYVSENFFDYQKRYLVHGGLVVGKNGIIKKVLKSATEIKKYKERKSGIKVINFGSKILMPGLIDSHVHINEPGREHWEGFITATKAAAAGGFTTIADMPLNSIPPTTTVKNLEKKLLSAKGKMFVDVAFWGGYIPDNIEHLQDMVKYGVVGFKCFLCPSGVEEFPHVNEEQIEEAFKKLENTGTVLAFHAELELKAPPEVDTSQPQKYETFLKSRSSESELAAIANISKIASKYNVKWHIVHLSSSKTLFFIRYLKETNSNFTVETCHHYLSLNSEDIPDARTEFKCCPPIREKSNQKQLWQAIIDGTINQVVSDHSPSTPVMKLLLNDDLNKGNFLKAWGGIASIQFGLPLLWTNGQKYDVSIALLYELMCLNPAKLLGIDDRKGKFEKGYDADFCVWDPNKNFIVTPGIIQFKNKITPYMNHTLRGVVHATYVRGHEVFNISKDFEQPLGEFVFRKYKNSEQE